MLIPIIKKNNFKQNMAIWMQPMRTHNLTQAQDLESYAPSIPITNITC